MKNDTRYEMKFPFFPENKLTEKIITKISAKKNNDCASFWGIEKKSS